MTAWKSTEPCQFPGCPKLRHGAELCSGHERQRYLGRELKPLRPHHRVVDGAKFCACCEQTLPIGHFSKKNHLTQENCRACRNLKLRAATYGTSLDWVRETLRLTTCQACGREFTSVRDRHIDHCHRSGEVRGLVCLKCNTALGCVDDDVAHLRALIAYLER